MHNSPFKIMDKPSLNTWMLGALIVFQVSMAHSNRLGHLTVLTPTLLNRNITLRFTACEAFGHIDVSALKWKVHFTNETSYQDLTAKTLHKQYDSGSNVYMDLVRVNGSWQGARIHITDGNLVSNEIRLDIHDFPSECGYLHLISDPTGPNESLEIGYYPNDKVLGDTYYQIRRWFGKVNDTFQEITLRAGIYEERTGSTNSEHILSIANWTEIDSVIVICSPIGHSHTSNEIDVPVWDTAQKVHLNVQENLTYVPVQTSTPTQNEIHDLGVESRTVLPDPEFQTDALPVAFPLMPVTLAVRAGTVVILICFGIIIHARMRKKNRRSLPQGGPDLHADNNDIANIAANEAVHGAIYANVGNVEHAEPSTSNENTHFELIYDELDIKKTEKYHPTIYTTIVCPRNP
ncbi:uncharacterized protein LOC127871369 isoform X2 [Dreissena polymorpha]|uniref:Uncharacterized protein n=1 Tax=Dreissena polymorpha TaxID=45954 RepID=A0A9D4LEQ6_DREPO|nr:uncharacterized protein LOC127871369 isoform X2 [Dreissena polymorpha]KAH3857272.1 hypothetical protein DPMN_099878 [Dreissena polymorpha]